MDSKIKKKKKRKNKNKTKFQFFASRTKVSLHTQGLHNSKFFPTPGGI